VAVNNRTAARRRGQVILRTRSRVLMTGWHVRKVFRGGLGESSLWSTSVPSRVCSCPLVRVE
jgi:hypothetical protein